MFNNLIKYPDNEYTEYREKMKNENYFFYADLNYISKQFLSNFLNLNIFNSMVKDIIKNYQEIFNDEITIQNESDFYKYIAEKYLYLNKTPKDVLFKLYNKASYDLLEIKSTIEKLNNKIKEIENTKPEKGFLDGEGRYKIKHIQYYIEKNKEAEESILYFLAYDIYNTAYYDCRIDCKGLSYSYDKLKRENYSYFNLRNKLLFYPNVYDIDDFSDLNNKMLDLDDDEHTRIKELLNDNKKDEVLEYLKKYMCENKLLEIIEENIEKNHILHERKQILSTIINHFNNKDYISVNNMLPLQIEGLFHDYCLLLDIKEKELNISALNAKLDKLKEKKNNLNLVNYEYFSFRFPIIRNKVAHGRYFDTKDEFQAIFLLFDLFSVCQIIIDERIPLNNYIKTINKTDTSIIDFDNLFSIIRLLELEIPSFYNNETIKLNIIKQQYLENDFLNKFKDTMLEYSTVSLEGFEKLISILKNKCEDKKNNKITKLFQTLGELKSKSNREI